MSEFLQKTWQAFYGGALFPLCLSVFTYELGLIAQRRIKSPLANPLLIATVLCIGILKLCGLTYQDYAKGGDMLMLFLGPATAVLALSIYNQREVLVKNLFPVLAATITGAVTSVVCVYFLGRLFGLDEVIIKSLMPKSVTTPIALSLSKNVGGMQAVTMSGVLVTGIFGAMFVPWLIKIFHIKSPVAAGLAIGTSCHAVGTAEAVQIGEIQGAMSSIAIGCTGIATTIVFIFIK